MSSHIHSHLDNLCPMHFPSELVSLWNFTSSAGPWLLRSWIRFGYDWSATNGKEGPNPVKKHSISRSEKVRILTSSKDPKLHSCLLVIVWMDILLLKRRCFLFFGSFLDLDLNAVDLKPILQLCVHSLLNPRCFGPVQWLANRSAVLCGHRHWATDKHKGSQGWNKGWFDTGTADSRCVSKRLVWLKFMWLSWHWVGSGQVIVILQWGPLMFWFAESFLCVFATQEKGVPWAGRLHEQEEWKPENLSAQGSLAWKGFEASLAQSDQLKVEQKPLKLWIWES